VLGEHVAQQGSEVDDQRLRFDFSNPRGLSPEEIDDIEARVNAVIRLNEAVDVSEEDLDEARSRGVIAAFGEKYGQRVRVVDMGGWSTELCGGTHVSRTGDIGAFVITSERAISAGVRRIEGATGPVVLGLFQSQRRLLREAALAVKASAEELVPRIVQLQKQLKEAKQAQTASSGADVTRILGQLKAAAVEKDGGIQHVVVDLEGADGAVLREVGEQAAQLGPDLVLVLFGREGSAVPFLVACSGQALERGFKAGDLAKVLSGHLGGGGGGRPNLAQGKGLDAKAIPAAIAALRDRM